MVTFQLDYKLEQPGTQFTSYTVDKINTLYLDGLLATQLDTVTYNLPKDWDIVILISGDRMVRVGKSKLASDIACYLSLRLRTLKLNKSIYGLNDIYFDSDSMIEGAIKKPKYSVNHYDEGREGLAAVRAMTKVQKDLVDFFNECGQLNQIFIIVLPDFFGLNEEMAVGRSEFLINVYRTDVKKELDLYKEGKKIPVVDWERGRFEFFNRYRKQTLYDRYKTTKKKSYRLVKSNFYGRFTKKWAIPYDEYNKKKREALKEHKVKREQSKSAKIDIIRNKIIMKYKSEGCTDAETSERLLELYDYNISGRRVNEIVREQNKFSKISKIES